MSAEADGTEPELTVAPRRVRLHEDPALPPTRFRLWLYASIGRVLLAVGRLLFHTRVEGTEHVPTDRPFILAPVHRSNLDFALVLACVGPRPRMRYLAKDTIWKAPFGRLWTALGAIPVHRGTPDREALGACIGVLRAGEPLVMFPEGTRQSGPDVQELFDGVAYVQSRTGVPIVPVGIGGSEAAMPKGAKFVRRAKVVLIVGEPLECPPRNDRGRVSRGAVRAQTEALHAVVQDLYDEAQRRAGTPNER
jgi:1-acyl-sn-glycerol-3-phosphate acyltransferase